MVDWKDILYTSKDSIETKDSKQSGGVEREDDCVLLKISKRIAKKRDELIARDGKGGMLSVPQSVVGEILIVTASLEAVKTRLRIGPGKVHEMINGEPLIKIAKTSQLALLMDLYMAVSKALGEGPDDVLKDLADLLSLKEIKGLIETITQAMKNNVDITKKKDNEDAKE